MSNGEDTQKDTGLKVLEKPKVKRPSFYKVLLLNDDYTPMDFVTHVLQKFFYKTQIESEQIMMEVHTKGKGIAGVFNFEIAETKMQITNTYAEQNRYPLKCIMEKD